MTEQDKRALIEKCKKDISQMQSWYDADDYSSDIKIYEIALASLTAPPVKLPDVWGYEHPEKEEPFYTLSKDEVIAAIRAAGYEVEE